MGAFSEFVENAHDRAVDTLSGPETHFGFSEDTDGKVDD